MNNITPQPYLSCTLLHDFQIYKILTLPYFSIFNRLKLQSYLNLVFSIEQNLSSTLLGHFQWKKTPAVPYFCFLNNITLQRYISRTIFSCFKQCKAPLIRYISILKRSKNQPYLTLAFKTNETPDVPYFILFNRIKAQQYLISAFSRKKPQLYLVFTFLIM